MRARVATKRLWNSIPPVYQIEQNNLGLNAMLRDAHEERAEKVFGKPH